MAVANDSDELSEQLRALCAEHRQLDESIAQLSGRPCEDELQLRRLKKRKLTLKDAISRLERLLDSGPDEYA